MNKTFLLKFIYIFSLIFFSIFNFFLCWYPQVFGAVFICRRLIYRTKILQVKGRFQYCGVGVKFFFVEDMCWGYLKGHSLGRWGRDGTALIYRGYLNFRTNFSCCVFFYNEELKSFSNCATYTPFENTGHLRRDAMWLWYLASKATTWFFKLLWPTRMK